MKAGIKGDGVEGFRRMHRWFTMTSGLGLAERRAQIMVPITPKKEEDVASAIENWERELLELEELEAAEGIDDAEKLPEIYKMAALDKLITGRLR